MSAKSRLALKELSKAFKRLQDASQMKKSEIVRGGTIQRFEFTFELLWKALKIVLQDKGVEVHTPKDSLRRAFRLGWIENEASFLEMLEARNKMSHLYDEQEAREIYKEVTQKFIKPIRALLETLKEQQD